MTMLEVTAKDLYIDPREAIGEDWAALAAEKDGEVRAMTISWGGMGVLWNKPTVTVFLRPQRYTKEFVDASETFTLSFFGGECKDALMHIGRVSGKDEGDKIAQAGLTLTSIDGHPTFEEAELVLVCKPMYTDALKPELIKDASVDGEFYPDKDYHTVYVCEIVRVFVSEALAMDEDECCCGEEHHHDDDHECTCGHHHE